MKKHFKRLCTFLVLFTLVIFISSCGDKDNNNQQETLNTYSSSYDKIVAKFVEEGVIGADVTPVDINTTPGYLKDNANNGNPNTSVVKVADIARDYNGIYLFWYDLKNFNNSTSMKSIYDSLKLSAQLSENGEATLVIEGGHYTLPLDKVVGTYAIAFSSTVEEATKTKALEVLSAIDSTKPQSLAYYEIGEFLTILKDKGYWKMNEQVDLNRLTEYSYPGKDWQGNDVTRYNSVASAAYECNGVRVLYFNIGSLSTELNNSFTAISTNNNNYSITFNMGTEEDTTDDKTYSIKVDAQYGYYVLSIDDTVTNKAQIIAEFNRLAK